MELTYKQKTRLWFDHIETYQNKNICNLLENLKFINNSFLKQSNIIEFQKIMLIV